MAKKKNKIVKKKNKPHKDLHHLTMLLKYTERNVTNDGSYLDNYFKDQASRIWKRLEEIT